MRNIMPVRLSIRDDRYDVVVDPLAEVLDVSHVRGAVLAHVCANDPWGMRLSSTPGAAFHAITAGTCWLRLDGSAPLQLMPGDVVLLPTGSAHDMVSTPDGRTRAYDRVTKEELMTPDGDLLIAGPGATTRFICAAYDYDHEVAHPLLSLLPPVVHIPADAPGDGGPIQSTLRLLGSELGGRSPGSRSVVTRLTDVLFVQVLREWLERESGGACWLRALRDPQIAQVIAESHELFCRRALLAQLHDGGAGLDRRDRRRDILDEHVQLHALPIRARSSSVDASRLASAS